MKSDFAHKLMLKCESVIIELLKMFKIATRYMEGCSRLFLTRMHMIVVEQAHTILCILVKIDIIYLKYSLIMYELSSGYLRDIFGIRAVEFLVPNK